MRYPLLVALCSLLFALPRASSQTPTQRLQVMEYNVENLFDTEDDPAHDDEAFLPTGAYRWTSSRYRLKLQHIAEVISAVGGESFPDLIGLVEVESAQVLRDLLSTTGLGEQAGYRYVVTGGEDRRGIDVALLYRPASFRLLSWASYPLRFPFDPSKRTRPLLRATGLLPSGDSLHIFVCHLPSRRGGARRSDRYRAYACERLRSLSDSLLLLGGERSHVLLLGDFNGEAEEPFIQQSLGAQCYDKGQGAPAEPRQLYALLHRGRRGALSGSYCYQGCWSQLDQFIVSGSLLRRTGLHYVPESAQTVRHAFYTTERGEPWRTYGGYFYRGGYSDHFPIRLYLSFDPPSTQTPSP